MVKRLEPLCWSAGNVRFVKIIKRALHNVNDLSRIMIEGQEMMA